VNIVRKLTPFIHALDHRIGHAASSTRRVLVEMRTPVYHAVLGPICDALATLPHTDIQVTSEYPERIIPLVGAERFLTHRQVEWRRFDLYLNADPWAAARLRRCAHRVNFFHGVAGKYDLDNPAGLPMGFEYYDRVAFINRDRMQRYLDAKVVTAGQACLIGYPKLDALASGRVDRRGVKERLGLRADRPTALYAPTYSPGSSLHLAGEQIVGALESAGLNVIIKLHDRSLDADFRYSAGIDWRARMRALEHAGTVRYVEGPDATPYLAAADVMVTDHSSVGFEYLVLDRPLIVFDAPDLPAAARINPEKIALLRSAATVVRTPSELAHVARGELADPGRLSAQRGRVAGEMFHEPGTATARALALLQELLEPATNGARSLQQSREPQPVRGGHQ
jgi:hypothetical protein